MAAKFGEPTVADDIFTPSIRNTVWFELEPRMKSDTGPPGPSSLICTCSCNTVFQSLSSTFNLTELIRRLVSSVPAGIRFPP